MVHDLDKIFQDIAKLKVAVVGDVMLDTYWWGNVDRISPEGPVPVVAVTKKEMRIGGAGNVGLNVRALATNVAILSVIGKDDEGKQLKNLLQNNKIDTRFILLSDKRMTTNKIRIIGRNQQMMRLDAERSNDLENAEEEQLIKHLEQYIQSEKPQVIILQDYNKGVLTERVITKVIELCNQNGIISTADPKRKNFFAYKNIALFKPNLKEVKESLHILSEEVNKDLLSEIHQQAGTLNENAVPSWALWAQCIVAAILCLSGKYGDLLDMISFVVVIFYVLTIAGIFILRKKRPDAERPYKAFGYPVLPAIYIFMGIAFCILLIIYKPQFPWPGLLITLIGIPLYYIALSNKNKANTV